MQINSAYEEHVSIMKELKQSASFDEVREPFKEDFEKIYEEAKESGIGVNNAKEFLQSLSKEELSTLQNYTLLVDDIKIDKISDEGAYNLLLHHYEKYDFNDDGFVENGKGKSLSMIPQDLPNDEKENLVKSLNELNDKDRFMTMALLFPPNFSMGENGDIVAVPNKDHSYESMMERIMNIINPPVGGYSSADIKQTFTHFKEILENNHKEMEDKNGQLKSYANNDSLYTKARLTNA